MAKIAGNGSKKRSIYRNGRKGRKGNKKVSTEEGADGAE